MVLRNHGTNTQKETNNDKHLRKKQKGRKSVAELQETCLSDLATRDVSLQGEQHTFLQPLDEEIEEQPKRVPPVDVG